MRDEDHEDYQASPAEAHEPLSSRLLPYLAVFVAGLAVVGLVGLVAGLILRSERSQHAVFTFTGEVVTAPVAAAGDGNLRWSARLEPDGFVTRWDGTAWATVLRVEGEAGSQELIVGTNRGLRLIVAGDVVETSYTASGLVPAAWRPDEDVELEVELSGSGAGSTATFRVRRVNEVEWEAEDIVERPAPAPDGLPAGTASIGAGNASGTRQFTGRIFHVVLESGGAAVLGADFTDRDRWPDTGADRRGAGIAGATWTATGGAVVAPVSVSFGAVPGVAYGWMAYGTVLLLVGGATGGGYTNLGVGAIGALFGGRSRNPEELEDSEARRGARIRVDPMDRLRRGLRPRSNPTAFWQVIGGLAYIAMGIGLLEWLG